jgi:hypothetical protein
MSFRNDQIPGDAAAVTPSDATAVDFYGLYIGGAGNLVVTTGAGNDVTFSSVQAGAIFPLRVVKVKSTGTTATNIVGFKA